MAGIVGIIERAGYKLGDGLATGKLESFGNVVFAARLGELAHAAASVCSESHFSTALRW
ncbi:hypothetical protein SAOR_11510 [Salinisphaera orenii MK-B5]|uniref:Uncharacterized protein n=1 Tax=Salinisphaera orenii MK-B5 TaxID=856730 RepID=A0A423PL67_9GAMM|nr:hypothetical protein SAOR_11510 [Salinisphaera orenii MK-B5]